MKLGYTILYVDNVIETVAFYETAFGLKPKMIHESQSYAEMDTGETTLAFASDDLIESHGFPYLKNTPDTPPAGIEIALVTDDVAAAYENAVNHGAIALKPPENKPWGQTVAYMRDLNGCLIEICSPM